MNAEVRILLLSTSLVAALAMPLPAAPASGTKKSSKTSSTQGARSSTKSGSAATKGSRTGSAPRSTAAPKPSAQPAPQPTPVPVPAPVPQVADESGTRKFLNKINPFKRGGEAAPAEAPAAPAAVPAGRASAPATPVEVAKDGGGTGRKILNKLTPWRKDAEPPQAPPVATVPRAAGRPGSVPPVPAAQPPAVPEVAEGKAGKLLDRINPMKLLKGGEDAVPEPAGQLAGRAAGVPAVPGEAEPATKESYFGNLFSGLGGKREPGAEAEQPVDEAPRRGGFWSNPLAALKRMRSDDLPPEVEPEKIPRPKDWTERKVIVEHGTPMYEFGPSQSQGPDMKLVRGTVVKEKKRERGWVLVEVAGGRRGYIAASAMRDALKTDFLEPPKSTAPKTMMAASGANPKSWAPGAPPPDLPDEAPMMDLDGALDLLPALQGSKDGKPATVTKPSAAPPVPVDLPPAPDPDPLPAESPEEKAAAEKAPEKPSETPTVPLPPSTDPDAPANPDAPIVPLPPVLPELPEAPEVPAEPAAEPTEPATETPAGSP